MLEYKKSPAAFIGFIFHLFIFFLSKMKFCVGDFKGMNGCPFLNHLNLPIGLSEGVI